MKKILSVILCVAVACFVFTACSKNDENKPTQTTKPTEITTDDAAITESDAIEFIKSYSADELGLSKDDMKNCSFMVAQNGRKIDKDYYIEVIATIKTEHKEGKDVSYTFDNKGEYYIRYDGKQILSKNLETGKYTEMKVKSATAQKESVSEKTTKK